ncbi:MAG: hypothetical protein IPL23_10495 [Saprospiraceae bacterium]|nr:hypothetical protein [Saprospiraceae bacterium]
MREFWIPIYATIISGDIGMPNEVTDNTNNIFYLTDANIQVLLDGLTLQDAFNNGNNRLGGLLECKEESLLFKIVHSEIIQQIMVGLYI